MIVNATYFLADLEVPAKASVEFVDSFEPSFCGFPDDTYFSQRNLRVEDFELGKSGRSYPDPTILRRQPTSPFIKCQKTTSTLCSAFRTQTTCEILALIKSRLANNMKTLPRSSFRVSTLQSFLPLIR